MTTTLHPSADAPTLDLDPLWLRSVLHDLGAPLQLLEAISKALIDEATEAERRAMMLKRLPGVIHRITTRIHTLSDVVRDPGAQGSPEHYPVYDLAQLTRMCLPYLQDVARMRVESRCFRQVPRVEALALERAPVRMFPIVFDRIIENLVVNSAEARAQSTLIVVSCTNDHATLIVLDDGPGFDPLILDGPKEGLSLKECGRGIGLAGVAVLVAQSDGTLELSNLEDGKGARVCIHFPLASFEDLARNEAELRELFARLAPLVSVLPEVAL